MRAIPVPAIAGAYMYEPTTHANERGFSAAQSTGGRSLRRDRPGPVDPGQLSRSGKGVVRGLHLRSRAGEVKQVRFSYGAIFDIVVDLLPGSPANREFVELPAGCAQRFRALAGRADVSYRIDRMHDPSEDSAIAFDDPELAIPWPLLVTLMWAREAQAPCLADATRLLR